MMGMTGVDGGDDGTGHRESYTRLNEVFQRALQDKPKSMPGTVPSPPQVTTEDRSVISIEFPREPVDSGVMLPH